MEPDEKIRGDRHKAYMEGDFNPPYLPTNMPAADLRLANAAEYAAYQLGQINQNLKTIVRLLGQKT
jgi:hypothetical protein